MEFDFTQGPFTGMGGSATPVDDFPPILTYEDARSFLWDSPESEILLGVDGLGRPVTVNLASDTPHIIVSAGSGAGKSVIAASMATQALVKGATAVFLDVKRISHRWAKNLPQVHYASAIEEIANALVSVAAEVHKRMRVIEESPLPIDQVDIGPRIILVAEELNATIEALKDFEQTLPRRGVYRPSRAFADIMNLGRAARVHVIGFAQYADATVIPKRQLESFGYKVLIRHTNESWKMLAWHLGYTPPAPQQVGRGFVVMGDKGVQTQFLYLAEEECAELVRTAYEARERMGLVPRASRKDKRAQRRELQRLERS